MDPEIEAYLENWTVTSEMSGEQIHLNPVQKREVNRFYKSAMEQYSLPWEPEKHFVCWQWPSIG